MELNQKYHYQFVFKHQKNQILFLNSIKKAKQLQSSYIKNQLQGILALYIVSDRLVLNKSFSTPNFQKIRQDSEQNSLNPAKSQSFVENNQNHLNQRYQKNNLSKQNQNYYKLQHSKKENINFRHMTSHDKKGYQYYFKKGQSSQDRSSLGKRNEEIKTAHYIKYESYEKMKQSGIQSTNSIKNFKNQRVSEPGSLAKRGSLYSSGYTVGAYGHSKESLIQNTTQKYKPKLIASQLPPVRDLKASEVYFENKIQEFKVEDSNRINRFQQNQGGSNSQNLIKRDENAKNFESIDLRKKNKNVSTFIESKAVELVASWHNEKINEGLQNTKISTENGQKRKIQVKNQLEQLELNNIKNQNTQKKPQTYRQQLNQLSQKSNLVNSCIQCTYSVLKISKLQYSIAQFEKKRQSNLDQILRQQKYIKQIQQLVEAKKSELITNETQLSKIKQQQNQIQKQVTQLKRVNQNFKEQAKLQLERQTIKISSQYEQRIHGLSQKISVYLNQIHRSNKKLQETQQNNRQNHKQMCLNYEKQILFLKQFQLTEINKVKEEAKQQNISVGKYYQERQKKLIQRQQLQIQIAKQQQSQKIFALKQQHKNQILRIKQQHEVSVQRLKQQEKVKAQRLNEEITQLKAQIQAVPQLNLTLTKIENQLITQKNQKYITEKQLSGYKLYSQTLRKDNDKLKEKLKTNQSNLQNKIKQISHLLETNSKLTKTNQEQEEILNKIKKDLLAAEHQISQQVNKEKLQEKQNILKHVRNEQKIKYYQQLAQAFKQYDEAEFQILQKNVNIIMYGKLNQDQIDKNTASNDFNECQQQQQTKAEESSISPSTTAASNMNMKIKKKVSLVDKNLQLQRQLFALKHQNQTKYKDLTAKYQQLTQSFLNKQKQWATQTAALQLFQTQIFQKQSIIDALHSSQKRNTFSLTESHEEQISTLEHKLQVLHTVIQGKEHQTSILQTEIQVLKQKNNSMQESVNQFKAQLKNTNLQLEKKDEENRWWKDKFKDLQRTKQDKDKIVIENTEVVKRLQEQLKDLIQQVQKGKGNFTELEQQNSVFNIKQHEQMSRREKQSLITMHEQQFEQFDDFGEEQMLIPQDQQYQQKPYFNVNKDSSSTKNKPDQLQLPFPAPKSPKSPASPSSPTNLQLQLLSQLQRKQRTITQLESQLQQTFEIVKVLKQQLELRDEELSQKQNQNYEKQNQGSQRQNQGQQKQKYRNQKQNQDYQGQPYPVNTSQTKLINKSNKLKEKKEKILNEYFTKVQEYYNEVLQVFGLDQITYQMINFDHLSAVQSPSQTKKNSKLSSSMKKKAKINEEGEEEIDSEDNDLTSFDHQGTGNQQNRNVLNTPQQQISINPLEQIISYVSSNQEEVLRIINQWIRKLQRQSLSIHQHKQKSLFFEQRLAQLQQENNLLSLQKLQIYDKYQSFILKLEQENNELQQKSTELGQKLGEIQSYVKEMQQLLNSTNNQCLKFSIFSLNTCKRQNLLEDLQKIYFNPYEITGKQKMKKEKQSQLFLLSLKYNKQANLNMKDLDDLLIESNLIYDQNKKGYWEEFYQIHNQYNINQSHQSKRNDKQISMTFEKQQKLERFNDFDNAELNSQESGQRQYKISKQLQVQQLPLATETEPFPKQQPKLLQSSANQQLDQNIQNNLEGCAEIQDQIFKNLAEVKSKQNNLQVEQLEQSEQVRQSEESKQSKQRKQSKQSKQSEQSEQIDQSIQIEQSKQVEQCNKQESKTEKESKQMISSQELDQIKKKQASNKVYKKQQKQHIQQNQKDQIIPN